MKSFKFVGMAIIAMVMGVNFVSCSSDDVVAVEPEVESPKEYIVSLGWTGEIVDITELPLATRAVGNNDLYGIQVYSRPDIDDGEQNSEHYAYGLFDRVGNMSIKLLEGYKYNFVASMVVDGKNKINSSGNSFSTPFSHYGGTGDSSTPVTNTFKYSTAEYLGGLHTGYMFSSLLNSFIWRPAADRYYGELVDYLPTQDGVANIKMKRSSFGIKVIAQEMSEGRLNIKLDRSIEMSFEYPEVEAREVVSFDNCAAVWYDGYQLDNGTPYEYSESIPVSFSWTKADGVELPLGTKTIDFKRNKLTVITVKVVDKGADNEIGITYDEAGEMEVGGTVEIDPAGSSDNNVNPEV